MADEFFAQKDDIKHEFFVQKDDIKHEGFLLKQSKVLKNMRKRWFVLTSEYLCSFKTQGDYGKPTEFIRLSECSSVTSGDADNSCVNSLYVVTPERTLYIIAASAFEKDLWMGAITNCCLPELLSRGCGYVLSKFVIAEEPDEDFEQAYDTGLAVMTRAPSTTLQSVELQSPKTWKNMWQAASQFLPMPFASKDFMQHAQSIMMFGIREPSMLGKEDEHEARFHCCAPGMFFDDSEDGQKAEVINEVVDCDVQGTNHLLLKPKMCSNAVYNEEKADFQLDPTKRQLQRPEFMLAHGAQQRAVLGKENEGGVANISPCSDAQSRETQRNSFRSTTEFKITALNTDDYNFKLEHTTLDGKIAPRVKDDSTHPTALKVKSALATGSFLQCPPKARGSGVKMPEGEVANISPRSDVESRGTERKPFRSTTEFNITAFNTDGFAFKLKPATLDGKTAPAVEDDSTHPTASKVKSALATGTFLQCPPKARAGRVKMAEGEVANISPCSDAQSRATQRKPLRSTTEFKLSAFNTDGYTFKLKPATLDGKIAPEVNHDSTHATASKVKSALATGRFLQCPPKDRAARIKAPQN